MRKTFIFFTLGVFVFCAQSVSAQETVSIPTLYPSPAGVYDLLRLRPRDIIANPLTCDIDNRGTIYYDKNRNNFRICIADGTGGYDWDDLGGGGGSSVWDRDTSVSPAILHPTISSDYIGIGTSSPQLKLTVQSDALGQGGDIIAQGDDGATLTTGGPGVRFFWYPKKAAFRAGGATVLGQWDDGNIGDYSIGAGYANRATAGYSVAFGGGTDATAVYATVRGGVSNKASADYSTATGGKGSTSEGIYSTILGGYSGHARGQYSTAFGGVDADGDYSTALGSTSTTSGIASTAGGGGLSALGDYSVVDGGLTASAQGLYATTLGGEWSAAYDEGTTIVGGQRCAAYGQYSTIGGGRSPAAEGQRVNGQYAVVSGGETVQALNDYAVAIGGWNSKADGKEAVSFGGLHSLAGATNSLAGGNRMRLDANAVNSFVWGYYNSDRTFSVPDAFIIYSGPGGINPGPIRVGIGTTTPAYLLDINGDLHTTGDIYNTGRFPGPPLEPYRNPDYVFDKDYSLRPIAQLKDFVYQQKHLPNMPTAKDVEKEGVTAFEQNRLLLEKIEEAYLYVFELESQLTSLEEEYSALKDKGGERHE